MSEILQDLSFIEECFQKESVYQRVNFEKIFF